MQYSIVNLSEVKSSRRIRFDSEYWLPQFKKYTFINSEFKILDVLSEDKVKNIKQSKNKNNFDYLEIANVSDDLDYTTTNINFDNIPDRATYILKNNDICVSTVRPNRNSVAYIKNIDNKVLIGTSGFCVLRINNYKMKSEFLLILTKTKHFIDYLIRENTATMYPAVTNEDILEYPLPDIKISFQDKIADLVNESYRLREQAKIDYKKAQEILEEELDIKNWSPKNKKTNIKKLSEIKLDNDTFRIDAEYFQPKYEEIINKIKSYRHGYKSLRNLVDIIKSIEVGSSAYTKEGIPYIRISNLNESGINYTNSNYISEKYYQELKNNYQPNINDILFSKDGTVGIAYKYNSLNKIIVSSGILRLCNSKVNSSMLTLLLNSILIKTQTERSSFGALIAHLSIDNIKSILIPSIPESIQEKISILVEASFEAKERAKKLLDVAKKGVEIAIEQSEDIASVWIEKELKQ